MPEPVSELLFEARALSIGSDAQKRALGLCGIDPGVFGTVADPAALVEIAAREAGRSGISHEGLRAIGHRLELLRPVYLEEILTLSGSYRRGGADEHNGLERSVVRFTDAAGDEIARAIIEFVRPSPTAGKSARRTVVEDISAMRSVGEVRLDPRRAAAYYPADANAVHFDAEAAAAAGLRAPILGGGHIARFLTGALWAEFAPTAIVFTLSFRRPAFWDDICQILSDAGPPQRVCLVRDGRVLATLAVETMITNNQPREAMQGVAGKNAGESNGCRL